MMSCDLVQPGGSFALLIQQRFRKPDDVHEQDMPDLELSIIFQLSGHGRVFKELAGMISIPDRTVESKRGPPLPPTGVPSSEKQTLKTCGCK